MQEEAILKLINENQLNALDLTDETTKDMVDNLLAAKVLTYENGQLIKRTKKPLVRGRLEVKPKFAFLLGEFGDYYIKRTKRTFTGDEVVAIVTDQEKNEADILFLQKREVSQLLFIINEKGYPQSADENYQNYRFYLEDEINLPVGTLFYGEIVSEGRLGYNIKYLNKVDINEQLDKKINILLAMNKIDANPSPELDALAEELDNKDYTGIERVDLTNLDFITIDGTYSKDLDDAVYLQKQGEKYHLYVSIADVDNFVKEGSPIDLAARERGTSVYFLNQVIPMLPVRLSNNLCSLNPHVNRYTMTCEMMIDASGEITDYKVYPSIINSKKRCTYSEVNDYLHRGILGDDLAPFQTMLDNLDELREILFQKRVRSGTFNFEEQEVSFVVDSKQNILEIVPIKRENGEKLIEEMMICANESVARIISELKLPFLYRIHPHPEEDQILKIQEQLKTLGVKIDNSSFLSSDVYAKIQKQLGDEGNSAIIDRLFIRLMPKAEYHYKNIGHFGLALENYTHFTSPIRRYADLMVHRLLKEYLYFKHPVDKEATTKKINEVTREINAREIAAQGAERDIIDLKKTQYMKTFVGSTFTGKISNIYENKVVIELENTVRGSIFLEDYYDFVKVEDFQVHFKDRVFKLLDEVKIKVKKVDEEKNRILFTLVGYKRKKPNVNKKQKPYKKFPKQDKVNKKYKVRGR